MTLAAPNVHDGGDFSADSVPNSDDEQLDDTPFLSHQLPEDHESFSEKFLRNILTHDYQNLMPRRREKFVEITKTVTVTEIVNGAPDKHPSSCEVKVTNVSPAGPHPVNVSIKHLHEKWHSCEELNGRGDLGKGTVIHIHETHKPFNYQKKPDRFVYEDVVNSKVDSESKPRPSPPRDQPLFNRSSDNVIDLEFRHPILVETQTSSNGSSRRRFADLRKRVSTTTKTSMTETEKVTTMRRSSSAHSTSSRRSYGKPEVHTLYYRKFVEEDHKDHKDHQDDSSDSGSVIIHRDSVTRRSRSADPLRTSPVTSPVAPPRKRLGREESLHYYRDDEEVMEQNQQNQQRRVTVKSPDDEYRKGNTSVSMNDTFERQNLTAGITSISMNNSCTDTSFESRFSTIPRARSSPPGSQRINHIHVNVIGPSRTPEAERKHPVVGRVGEDVTMDIFIERRHQRSASGSRRGSAAAEAPPKPPRRSKYEEHHHIGEPLATSTPMTTIERKQTREERISTESGQSSRKSTRSARPPDINIIECETILRETRSPARTPATPIVVINQTPSSRRSSQDLLGDPGQRRRKSTVTDIDWYAAFNMKDPSSPTKPVRPPFAQDERKSSRDIRRRASDSSMIGIPPADIDLNQIFTCTNLQIKKDEKCQCNACRLIRMSEAERASRMIRESRTRQSRSYQRVSDYESRSSTLPSRHRTSPVEIRLEDVFNPKPTSKPPTPPNRRRPPTAPTPSSSVTDEPGHPTRTIDRSQVTTNSEGPQLHAQLLSESVGHMIHDAQEWEVSRKSSTASSTARKASVARRISVDELTKPEKRKSKHSVSLPPSDVSIDDIFTALTHKNPPAQAEPEKKTFIVTRKQRAQDIDPIDFEKDRPVAPPRTKKDPSIFSEATVILELTKPDPVISTASVTMSPEPSSQDPVPIDLENVFSGKDTLKRRAENTDEDEKIKRRVAEFEKSQQEKLANRMEEKVEKTAKTRRTSWENSDISMDDVFEKKRVEVVVPIEGQKDQKVESTASIQLDPVTSEATISLDDVFAHGEAPVKSKDSEEDEKIRRRIAEFQRAEQEKKSQKSESRDVATRNLETSEISMEAVFNASAHSEEVVETKICAKPVQKLEDSGASGTPEAPKDVVSSASINLKDAPASSEDINLDDVFTRGNHPVDSSKQDEEDRKIKRRIAEFQRSQQEKERQTEVEDHSRKVERTVVESDISMDDVFNTSKPEAASKVSEKILEVLDVRKDPIDLFVPATDSKAQQRQEVQEKEVPIQKAIQERLDQIDESANKNRTSAVSIDIDDVFTTGTAPTSRADDEEDKKIRRRVAEFEKSQAEKKLQKAGEDTPVIRVAQQSYDPTDISMDVVFNVPMNREESASDEPEPSKDPEDVEVPKSHQTITMRKEVVERSDISLDAVFSSSTHQEKVDEEIEASTTSASTLPIAPQLTVTSSAPLTLDDLIGSKESDTEDKPDSAQPSTSAVAPDVTSSASINLDDVFSSGTSKVSPESETDEDKKIRQRIAEFQKAQQDKESRTGPETTQESRHRILEDSDIQMGDVFNFSSTKQTEDPYAEPTIVVTTSEEETTKTDSTTRTETSTDTYTKRTEIPGDEVTTSASISLDDVFSSGASGAPESNTESDEDKKIRQRIAEFQKAQQDKESRSGEEKQKETSHRILEDSDIPMSDVFNFSSTKKTEDPYAEPTIVVTNSEEETTKTDSTTRTETSTDTYTKRTEIPGDEVTTSASISLDDVFSSGASGAPESNTESDEDKKIRQRIAEFQKAQQDKESRSGEEKQKETSHRILEDSDIPMSDVFNFSSTKKTEDPYAEPTIVVTTSEEEETKTDSTTRTETSTDTYTKRTEIPGDDATSSTSINLDDIFSSGTSKAASESETDEDKKIRQRIAEFQKAQQDKESRTGQETTQESIHRILEDSDIPMSDVFNFSSTKKTEDPHAEPTVVVTTSEEKTTKTDSRTRSETSTATYTKRTEIPGDYATSSIAINLDDVFSSGASGLATDSHVETDEDKKIRQRIVEFQKAQQDKESRTDQETTIESIHRILEDSDIPMSDIFNFSPKKKTEDPQNEPTVVVTTSEEETTKTDSTTRTETSTDTYTKRTEISGDDVTPSASINLDDVFQSGASGFTPDSNAETDEDKKIRQRIAEFQKAQQDKESRSGEEKQKETSHRILEASDIPMSDVFNFSNQKPSPEATIFKTSEEETTKASTSTKTSTDTYTKRTGHSEVNLDDVFSYSKQSAPTLDDLFGPQTPTAIPTVAITSEDVPHSESESRTPLTHKSLSNLLVPGKWNDSMMSTTSTISLDDSFNNSLAEPKMRKPLSLPVDNWIDDLVAKTTDEATREAPKTPKSGTYFPSPTRISQEIKYEWVADLVGVQEQSEDLKEDTEEHQTNEEHLQKQDSTWVSSVVYRPTLETSAYTLRASQNLELDMDKVFEECLKKKDDEECECTACRLTEQELEEMRKKEIEKQVVGAVEETSSEPRKPLEITNPSQFSIDEIFHPEVPLHIQTGPSHQVPSTSSPPLENTRTYYLSPKVSETVTTTHQWKDADISIDEIFSPVSSTNDNRRFSNFYEDRSGWDTIGSEDSGVMSGGDRPRRRSSRTVDRVIDEAFKDIFENQNQPSTSEVKHRDDQPETETETQYDDFYITSLNEGDIEATDSEVDGENLDVTQFVDDILGKSLDEAAFLSSTKSLRDHTDTSIDRKKSGDRVHPYYRTRTDTSIDKRSKPEVITEDHEGHDEIMKLVFVDRSLSTSTSKGSLSRASGVVKPNDEELLEIEIKSDCFLIKGSYSLLIPKTDPLGQMLQKLRDQNDSLATLDFSLTRKLKKLLVNCIREKAMSPSDSPKYDGLSSRGQSLIESIDHASSTFLRMNVDKFEPTRNPQGIVNFCTAENNICTPLLEEKFKHLELFFPNTEHLVRYPPSGGWPEAREVLVKYFKEFMSARVTTEELVLTASTRTGYDVVSYCLFEQDDVLLTNGPVYTGTISNVQERALCKVECVPTDLSNPRLEVKKYEEELSRQTALDNTVSGIIIVNPHNPLGVVFPPEDVVNLCNWAASKNLHVIIDEVFANCVFDKSSSKFRPFLSYRHRVHRPENIAWLWSVSKDFGLPGLKFAVIHSANEGLRKAALKLQLYHPCSPFVQDFTVKLLSDSEWLREFHGEVTRRMAIHYRYTAENLKRLEIPFVPAQAGIFVFADFSKHLTSNSQLGELDLFERLGSAGVMLTPGVHQKCHVFGWFRLVFACSKQELEEGFRRLFTQLGSHLQPVGSVLY